MCLLRRCCGNEIIRRVTKLRCYVIDHWTHALLRRIHPGNRDEVFIWQNFPACLPRSRLEKTEISVTEPGRPLIWPHRKFYKGFRSKARSRKPGQPGQQGSYEEALSAPDHIEWVARNQILLFVYRFLGSPRGKHCNSLKGERLSLFSFFFNPNRVDVLAKQFLKNVMTLFIGSLIAN